MKRIVVRATVLGLSWLVAAGAAAAEDSREPATRLTLQVSGLKSSAGSVRAALFRSPKGFPGDTGFAAELREVPIESRQATVVFEDAPCADGCAVSLFHDENGNQGLDRNFAGIPSEGIGISLDAQGLFGPKSFEAAAFRTREPALRLEIPVRYY